MLAMLNDDANVTGVTLLWPLLYGLRLVTGGALAFTGEPRDAFAAVVAEVDDLFLGERDEDRGGLREPFCGIVRDGRGRRNVIYVHG